MFLNPLNPFNFIFETTLNPHARTLRTGFWQKVKDAFNLFSGEVCKDNDSAEVGTVGLVSWAMLILPWIFERLSYAISQELLKKTKDLLKSTWHSSERIAFVLLSLGLFLTGIIFAPLFLIRNSVAFALTIISLPVITMVSLVSSSFAKEAKDTLLNATVKVGNQDKSLALLLKETGMDLEDLTAIETKTVKENDTEYLQFRFSGFKAAQVHTKVEADKIKLNVSEKEVRKAIEKLNLGNYVQQAERSDKPVKNLYFSIKNLDFAIF